MEKFTGAAAAALAALVLLAARPAVRNGTAAVRQHGGSQGFVSGRAGLSVTKAFWNRFSMKYESNCLAWHHFSRNPVLPPLGNSWQKRWTANPDFLNFGGKTLLYYRGDGTTSADDGAFHDQIGVAELNGISTKGISYELLNHGHPIVPIGRKGSFDDGMVLDPSAVQFGSRVFLYYSAIGTPGYHIGLAVSSDGVHFRKMGPVIEGGIFHRRYVCPGSPIVDDGSSIRAHGREPGFRLPPGVPRKLTGPEIFSLSSRVSWGYQGPLCYIDS